jgi:hypothetical protein
VFVLLNVAVLVAVFVLLNVAVLVAVFVLLNVAVLVAVFVLLNVAVLVAVAVLVLVGDAVTGVLYPASRITTIPATPASPFRIVDPAGIDVKLPPPPPAP